ncbi:MAG: hypothetical protein ACK4M8_02060 [Allorhizobium sp.]
MRFLILLLPLLASEAQALCLTAPSMSTDPVEKEVLRLQCLVEQQEATLQEMLTLQYQNSTDMARMAEKLEAIERRLNR